MLRILSFVANPQILPVLDRLVNKQDGWSGDRAPNLSTASEQLQAEEYDFVLLGAGTGSEERAALQEIIDVRKLKTRLIDHFGGGSGLLYAEVIEKLGEREKES